MARTPETWHALQQAAGEERHRLIKASLYESVRIITPLLMQVRRAEEDCTLTMRDGDGQTRTLAVQAGQLVIGLNVAPLWDPEVFPDPEIMRLELRDDQRERIRFAWGLPATRDSGAPDRFCQGFAYSIALLTAAMSHLLEHCEVPTLEEDRPIQMFGTRSRRGFTAALSVRSSTSAEAARFPSS